MKIYNILIAAHVDSGKTSITEHMLYRSGTIRSLGRVDSKNTQTDSLDVEKRRGISVKSSYASFEWNDAKINLIDTPGHTDFASEVDRALVASDAAVLVLSAADGVQAHAEAIFDALGRLSLPTLIFINKTDRESSDFSAVVNDLSERLEGCFLPLYIPENEGGKECRPVLADNAYDIITDTLSLYDDSLAEKLILGERIEAAELTASLKKAVTKRQVFPVFCGSALLGVGIDTLLDGICALLPSSDESRARTEGAVIFGIDHDASHSRICHVRSFGKTLTARDTVCYSDDRENDKISQIRGFSGVRMFDTGILEKGDIASVYGLSSARLYDVIGEGDRVTSPGLASPFLSVRVSSESCTANELLSALYELEAEDPLLLVKWESEKKEIIISITGPIKTEILAELLLDRYGYRVSFSAPSVIYKETPKKSAHGAWAYTMPKPCWAIVDLLIEPLPRGSGVVFDMGNVPHNKLFYKYQEHIKRSFFESLEQGPMGWEVTDIKATLADGEHHTIHTHPLDFFVATPVALMRALRSAGTTLLEPMLRVRITLPSEYLGRIMSDTLKMRGELLSHTVKKDTLTVECMLPVSESMDYPTELARITSGRAIYTPFFGGYRALEDTVITTDRRGVDPLDTAKWILHRRGAIK